MFQFARIQLSDTSLTIEPKRAQRLPRTLVTARSSLAVVLASLAAGCDAEGSGRAPGSSLDTDPQVAIARPQVDPCSTPNTDCPCPQNNAKVSCGKVLRETEGAIWCSEGIRECTAGVWGDCEGDRVYQHEAASHTKGAVRKASAVSNSCGSDNPCDPYCQIFQEDTSALVDLDGALVDSTDGLQLAQSTVEGGSASSGPPCTGITINPPAVTVTVSDFNDGGPIKVCTPLDPEAEPEICVGPPALEATDSPGLLAEWGPFVPQFSGFTFLAPEIINDSWVPLVTTTVSEVNEDWGNGTPGPSGIAADNFLVRYSGYIEPLDGSNTLFFQVLHDDGARLYIDGTEVLNQWADGVFTTETGELTLDGSRLHYFELHVYEHAGGAKAQVQWAKEATVHCYSGGCNGFSCWPPGCYSAPNYVDLTSANLRQPTRAPGPPVDGECPASDGSGEVCEFIASPLLVDPLIQPFVATGIPAGCSADSVDASWTLGEMTAATITQDGEFQVFSPEAGPVLVNAYSGGFTAQSEVTVVVDMATRATGISAATAALFSTPTGSSDPMTVRYPYEDTVFPLGLQPPVIQWNTNGTSASAVKVSLRYPADTGALFSWSEVLTESNPPRAVIPERVWRAFESTAKGDEAAYVVQRIAGGVLRQEDVRLLRFAQAPLRGKIVYTEYHDVSGSISAATKVVTPDINEAASLAFTGVNSFSDNVAGCSTSVCHTVSANGKVFATTSYYGAHHPGISKIDEEGNFSHVADHPDPDGYSSISRFAFGFNDLSRGFAWAPLTPDGTYALQADGFFGNTFVKSNNYGANNDPADRPSTSSDHRTVDIPDTYLSGAAGIGLLGEYFDNRSFAGVPWSRTDPTIDFDWNASPPKGLSASDFSVQWTGTVMPYYSEALRLEVTSTGGIELTVDGQLLIDDLGYAGGSRTVSATVNVQSATPLAISMRYVGNTSNAEVALEWVSDQSPQLTPRSIVPQTQLDWDVETANLGALGQYFSDASFSSLAHERFEATVGADFGSALPVPEISGLPYSALWQSELEVPEAGTYTLCAEATGVVSVQLDGTSVASSTNSSSCGPPQALAAGTYPLSVQYVSPSSGSAKAIVRWQAFTASGRTLPLEVIPAEYLSLPAGYPASPDGLTGTFYAQPDFNASLAGNANQPRAMQRRVPQLNASWFDSRRPEYSELDNSNAWSARFTGQIVRGCSGPVEFRAAIDDQATLWVDDIRVFTRGGYSPDLATGVGSMQAGVPVDFKLDLVQTGGGAGLTLEWKNCAGVFEVIPSSAFLPDGDRQAAGLTRAGGENSSGIDYSVFALPQDSDGYPNAVAVDMTHASDAAWGLSGASMMVPAFSPDGERLVFVDGDQGGGAGWRKGLSVFDFNETKKQFTARRTVVNNWPFGDVIKWPTFESDSRTVLYSASPTGSWCCKNSQFARGYMAPTDYGETPGRLFSIDTDNPDSAPVLMARATEGELAVDHNKAWQPTSLPVSAGGYRWVVFTSTRPYGNSANRDAIQGDYSDTDAYAEMLNYYDAQSQLWVAAIDDTPSTDSDRSHPAFWLPNQQFGQSGSGERFINERGFWALDGCKAIGTSEANECSVAEDCCGATGPAPTATCQLDIPVTSDVRRHCQALPPAGSCAAATDSCVSSSDCCATTVCVEGICTAPPSFTSFAPANAQRQYEGTCAEQEAPVWGFFDWQAVTPDTNSLVEFYAQGSQTGADFDALPAYPDAVTHEGVVFLGRATGETEDGWVGTDVGQQFEANNLPNPQYVNVTMRFVPNEEGTQSPVLTDYRLSYSCPPDK